MLKFILNVKNLVTFSHSKRTTIAKNIHNVNKSVSYLCR